VAQDLTFHLCNDMLLGGLGRTSSFSFLHLILFSASVGMLVRLIFEVYTKFIFPDRLSYLRFDTVRLDLSFESLQMETEIITEDEIFEKVLKLTESSSNQIKYSQRLRVWMTGVTKIFDEYDPIVEYRLKKERKLRRISRGRLDSIYNSSWLRNSMTHHDLKKLAGDCENFVCNSFSFRKLNLPLLNLIYQMILVFVIVSCQKFPSL